VLGHCQVDCPTTKGKLMPKVIYNGNGNTGGSVTVDNTSYAANGSFTVAGPGSLTPGSGLFFYWNTKADGTRNVFGPTEYPSCIELGSETRASASGSLCVRSNARQWRIGATRAAGHFRSVTRANVSR
jgi:hypothetical protein